MSRRIGSTIAGTAALAVLFFALSGEVLADNPGGNGGLEVVPVTAGQVLEAVRNSGEKVVLVNVWATWCSPCLEEFPELVKLQRNYAGKGLRVIFVSADFAEEVDGVYEFLAKQGVDFRTYLKTGNDEEFISTLNPGWSGALPATLIFDGGGRLVNFREGKASYEKFERMVLDILGE